MSNITNIIKLENIAGKELESVGFVEFEKGVVVPVKKADKGQFVSDLREEAKNKKFDLGGGFVFRIDHGERDEAEKKEAEDYLGKAKIKVKALEKEAYGKGLEEGREEGMKEVEKTVSFLMDSIKNTLAELVKLKDKIYAESEKDTLDLVFLIARKVIGREVEVSKEAVLEAIRMAMKHVIAKDEISIDVNPEDVETAKECKNDFKSGLAGIKGVVIEANPAINRGGCIIKTSFGSVDSRIETKIDEIEKVIRGAAVIEE